MHFLHLFKEATAWNHVGPSLQPCLTNIDLGAMSRIPNEKNVARREYLFHFIYFYRYHYKIHTYMISQP